MPTTDDRNDPRLAHGPDDSPVGQASVYLVLSDEERAKGFIRPVRRSYVHVGRPGPKFPFRNLTDEEQDRYSNSGYVRYEPYPETENGPLGRFWTWAQLEAVDKGCGAATTMGQDIAETYARQPAFYGSTYCVSCAMHLPVGADGEFVWDDGTRVGT